MAPCSLANRLVFPAFYTRYADMEGRVTERTREHYRRIAAGGVGLIIGEFTGVSGHPTASPGNLGIWSEEHVEGLAALVADVHAEGVPIIAQLAHSLKRAPRTVNQLTAEDIEGITRDFARGARNALAAGFDGVELHMAHTQTLSDFLSRLANRRRDGLGGPSARNRLRVPVAVTRSVREALGPGPVLAARIAGDEFIPGGSTLADALVQAPALVQAGCDFIDISAGGRHDGFTTYLETYSGQRCMPDHTFPDAANAYLGAAVKGVVDVPVLIAGKIGSPQVAEGVLASGQGDLVALGRALFADPDWPRKVREGHADEIRRCRWCNHCTWMIGERVNPIECILWTENKNAWALDRMREHTQTPGQAAVPAA